LPARFHSQLLDIFSQNLFSRPRALTILGTPIDLSEVKCDKYIVAGVTDHITPWKGVYNTARAFGGKTRFVLSSSGHIQSLINPPGNPKAKFFLNAELPASADEWLATAKPEADSWWSDWRQWLGERSGERRLRQKRQATNGIRRLPTHPAPTSLKCDARHQVGLNTMTFINPTPSES
jgi:polyhydroxyalkanoate synthase